MTRRVLPLLAAAAALLAAGCAGTGTRQASRAEGPSGLLIDGGVAVTAVLGTGPDGTGQVRVTFTPDRSGYHLYSASLPPGGVSGLGTPTSVTAAGALRAAGRASASEPVRDLRLPELGVTLPVYPDGPVTITLPVRRAGPGRPAVAVTYGACSTATCLPPVRSRVISLR